MTECMDEYLKSINVWAISQYNISSYVRKKDSQACVLDAMALVMDRESYLLLDALRYMLDTYPHTHQQIYFQKQDDNMELQIGMTCENLIRFLCNIPGKECRYRLYRYSEALIKYLEGDHFLINVIINSKESEDTCIMKKCQQKRKAESYKEKICRFREFEMYMYEKTQFPGNHEPSKEFIEEMDKIKKNFYQCPDTSESLDFVEVNEMRKIEVENFMYIQEASKLKKTDEVNFSQIITDMGYKDDFFKRMKCFEYGEAMKENKGHKKVARKGTESKYLFTLDDIDDMKLIVAKVYNEP